MGHADAPADSGDDAGDGETVDEMAIAEPDDQDTADHQQAKIEVTIGWLVGLIASSLGFLLAMVSVTLPWTFVYLRPGQTPAPGAPQDPFLTRISNYEPASTLTVLLVIGYALLVAATSFGSAGPVNRVLRTAAPAIGVLNTWFIGVFYLVQARTIGYGYTKEIGESVRFDRAVYDTAPSTGLALCCVGVMMMAFGSALATRPDATPRAVVAARVQLHRRGYLSAGLALVMLFGSFFEPWSRQPSDPTSIDPVWGGPPRLESWLAVFRFTMVAALLFLAVLLLSKSARVRTWMTKAGIITCTATVAILLVGRMIASVPGVMVDIRPTYYLAVGAAVLLAVAFLDAARDEVWQDTPLQESS